MAASQAGYFSESDGASRMQATLRLEVGLVGDPGVIKAAKRYQAARYVDLSFPLESVLVPDNAKVAALVIGLRALEVLPVNLRRYISKIFDSVVVSDSVDVVNGAVRPYRSHVQPRESVRGVENSIHSYRSVPAAGYAARMTSIGSTPAPGLPIESARLRIVVEQFAQTLRGKIIRSHEALLLLIGQRPARDLHSLRASLFSLGV